MAQATHTHKWPTHQPQCNTLWCMPWCPSTMPLTHTPKEEDHGLMAKVASTTCHHYEREGETGWWTVELRAWTSHLQHNRAKGGTTQAMQPSLKLHQQPPHHHTHHTSVVMVTHCLLTLTHTRGARQDKEHTTTKPMVWMACTVTMVWHKRGCGVVLPSSLVQHVVAPTPSKWPRAHHTALQPPQHPCFLVSTHVPQPVHTHPHVCVCVTVALSHPPCPQVWSSTTVCPASPPPGPSSTTNHQQQQQWQHKSKRVW